MTMVRFAASAEVFHYYCVHTDLGPTVYCGLFLYKKFENLIKL